MTRREEIENNIGYKMTKAALEYVEKHEFADAMDAFEAGAEWANKTMIDKACEYLKNALYEVASGVTNSFDIMSIENTTMDDFIDGFRKAMEE